MNQLVPQNSGANSQGQRGSVLILVLVVIAMLTLGAYSFFEIMVSESEATAMYSRQAETRAFAESGIELVAAVLATPETEDDVSLYHNPGRFQAVLMRDSENARGRGYFSVVAPIEVDSTASLSRSGLVDESGRLNVNQILKFELSEDESRELLMYLPDMTEEVADAILDWIDDDETLRAYGAEGDYYSSLDPPYYAKNSNLASIDELLQVAGVTADLLYGEDANRNGLLDPNENDGDANAPFDNADGILQPGWAAFLTVNSRELNQRADGTDRIFVNNGVLDELYDTLVEEFDEDVARFVVAFRMSGPYVDPNDPAAQASGETSGTDNTSPSGSSGSSGSGSASSKDGAESIGTSKSDDTGNTGRGSSSQTSGGSLVDAAAAIGNALGGSAEGAVTRGGMDLAKGAKYETKSIYELIGARTEVEIDGQKQMLDSPWSADAGSMQSYLPALLDMLTTIEGGEIPGRINVNQARMEVLLGIPGMTEEIAMSVTSSPMIGSQGEALTDQAALRTTTGWLVSQGIVDLPTMVTLDRFLTGRGHVFRAQIVGFFEEGGGYTRLEATIDATQSPAKVVSVMDLTELGRGYSKTALTGIVYEPGN
ncbi:MAG: type II secretion system protein GspK [Planctomycetota bacterium]|nr:type II secretion system protein GspK [Planctomycetota bacterium]